MTHVKTAAHSNQQPTKTRADISFPDSCYMHEILGNLDSNIFYIEQKFDVTIGSRGADISIHGARKSVEQVEVLFRELYRQAECGHEISQSTIDAHIKSLDEPEFREMIRADKINQIPDISIKTRKKTIFPRTPNQAAYIRSLKHGELVFALGPAGTGKTYLAVAQAVSKLITGEVEKLILSRPAVEAGEKLGFLPGDMKEKVDPYLRPIYDALHDCMPSEQVERRIASGEIEVAPLAFMRGRTLKNAYIILDEAQNTTPAQMKMFLTRFGEGSRMVICGDPNQSDIPGGTAASGLTDAISRLHDVEGIEFTRFNAKDVVRHPVVGKIVEAYEGNS